MVRGGGTAKYGGFLGILMSIVVPIAINLISKMFGNGLLLRPPPLQRRSLPPPGSGEGMRINLSPFFGNWGDHIKKNNNN